MRAEIGNARIIHLIRYSTLNMDWVHVVGDRLLNTGFVAFAAVYNTKMEKLASSIGFEMDMANVEKVFAAFGEPQAIRASGVVLNSTKYFVTSASPRVIHVKIVVVTPVGVTLPGSPWSIFSA